MFDIFNLTNEQISLLENMQIPSTYYNNKTIEYKYWFRSLMHKIDSALVFSGLPEGWNNDFFMFCLWIRGYVAVFNSNRSDLMRFGKNGILFQPCIAGGELDFYYQPSIATIANPHYEAALKIHDECELLKLTPDCFYKCGVLDIIDFYASKLAEISKSIDMGLINAKMPMILTASNEAQSATLKKVYDKVQRGESLVIYEDLFDGDEIMPRKDPFEFWNNDFTKTYLVTTLLEDMQTILNSFYNEIGLPVAVEKKERLITSEAEFTKAQSQARIACWYETINECLELINKKFNTNIEVTINASENDDISDRERTEQGNKKP